MSNLEQKYYTINCNESKYKYNQYNAIFGSKREINKNRAMQYNTINIIACHNSSFAFFYYW